MGEVTKEKLKKAEKFISEKCASRGTFPVLLKKFLLGIKKGNEEACILTAKSVKAIIKSEKYAPIQKYLSLQLIKEGMNAMAPIFITHVRLELLDDLCKLAEFEKSNKSLDRGRNLFDKLCKKNPDQDYSLKFFALMLECLFIWNSIIPENQDQAEYLSKYQSLLSKGVAFPSEENIQYYFEEFGDEGYGADMNNPRDETVANNNGNTTKPKEVTKPPVLPGMIEINDKLAAVVELRQGLRMYLDQIGDVDDLLMGLIQEYDRAFKEFEPMNNLIMGSEEAHFDVLREKGIKEFCFQAEFLEMTENTLLGKGNFVGFKQQLIHLHTSFFEDDEQGQAGSIFKKPQRAESV
jgi:hypothetical protein